MDINNSFYNNLNMLINEKTNLKKIYGRKNTSIDLSGLPGYSEISLKYMKKQNMEIEQIFHKTFNNMFSSLPVKYRKEGLNLDGKKIPYNQLCFMRGRKTNGMWEYVPLFEVKEDIQKLDVVFNAFPFYVCAFLDIAFMMTTCEDTNEGFLLIQTMLKELLSSVPPMTENQIMENINSLVCREKLSEEIKAIYSTFGAIRGTNRYANSNMVVQLIVLFIYLYVYDKRTLFTFFISMLDYFQVPLEAAATGTYFGQTDFNLAIQNCNNFCYPYKSYEYQADNNKKYRISNGGGISVGLFALFFRYLVKDYQEFSDMENVTKKWNRRINKCMGEDLVTTIITTQNCDYYNIDEAQERVIWQSYGMRNIVCSRNSKDHSTIRYNGKNTTREAFENLLLYYESLKMENQEDCYVTLPQFFEFMDLENLENMGYLSMDDLAHNMTSLYYLLPKNEQQKKMLERRTKDLHSAQEENKRLKKQISEYFKNAKKNQDQEERIKALQETIEKQKILLKSKNTIISDLKVKEKHLNEEICNFYDDTNFNVEENEDLSIKEMTEVLSGFKILLLGGRNNILEKLENLGLTGVFQIGNLNSYTGSANTTADFFIINTRFISHKIVSEVQKHNKDKLDRFIYYNGTNPEALIRICYTHVVNYSNL